MNWTALPIRGGIWLCYRDDTGIRPVREIPSASSDSEVDLDHVVVGPRGTAAVFSGRTLHLVPPDGSLPTVVALPDDLTRIFCAHFRGEVLYIGGQSSWQDTSRLGWIDVADARPTWEALEPPEVVGDPSLPVYALMSNRSRLIALDGSFNPKLAVLYDISNPRAPQYAGYASIASGVDDIPIDASVGRAYAAILSKTQTSDGRAWKIGLFDAQTMDEVATFYEHSSLNEQLEVPTRVVMHRDLMLVAHDLEGVGVLRLEDRLPTDYPNVEAIRPWAQSYVPIERIRYHRPLGQGRVIDIQPTPRLHSFYVVLNLGGRTWWEEIELR